jgi:hypothetical protein
MKLIGSGQYSDVYRKDNTIIKALKNSNHCQEAATEFNKQHQIYDSFHRLAAIDQANHTLLNQIKHYVRVARPIKYNRHHVNINERNYSCSLEMTRLPGLPFDMIKAILPNWKENVAPSFMNTLSTLDVMLHLSFNNPTKTTMMGTEPNKKISIDNPLRGLLFNIDDADEIIEELSYNHGLNLSSNELRRIVGFIYGWIYYDCRLFPRDIEITLGCDDKGFCINVLDFGLVYPTTMDDNEKKIWQIINEDEYVDIFKDTYAKEGFIVAREESRRVRQLICHTCNQPASLVDENGVLYCSIECYQ